MTYASNDAAGILPVAQRAAASAAAATPALTLSVWLDYLHGVVAELAFWAAAVMAIGGAIRMVWDLADRIKHRRTAGANRSPATDLDTPSGKGTQLAPPPPPPVSMG